MYDIKALEEEWKRYRRKKRRPLYFALAALLVAVITAGLFLSGKVSLPTGEFLASSGQKPHLAADTPVYIDEALTKLEEKKQEQVIDAPVDPDIDVSTEMGSGGESAVHRKKIHIEVIEARGSRDSLKEVAKRFRLGHDTDDSLFLAKSYYEQGAYKKAEYWALQTNKVNENIEESWLLFAKAKVKRGQRNEAIRILNAYIKRTHSVEARVLLEKIKKGVI